MNKKYHNVFCLVGTLLLIEICFIQAIQLKDLTSSTLNSGCITSGNQIISPNTAPATVSATAASGGSCTSYSYQWQMSFDSVQFYNITGATAQNLSYTSNLSQTTYFQRRTTCGSEVVYTRAIKVIPMQTVYARLSYENMVYYSSYTTGDVVVRFYSDAACTQPTNVSGLPVNYDKENSCTPVITMLSATCSGTSTVLEAGATLWMEGGFSTPGQQGFPSDPCYIDYYLNPGNGYIVN